MACIRPVFSSSDARGEVAVHADARGQGANLIGGGSTLFERPRGQRAIGRATGTLVKSPQRRSDETGQNVLPLSHAERDGHAGTDLAYSLAIDACSA